MAAASVSAFEADKLPCSPGNKASGTGIDIGADTAVLSTISSSQGGVVLRGGAVNLQGVQLSAAKDIAHTSGIS